MKEWIVPVCTCALIAFVFYHIGYQKGRRRLKRMLERAGSIMADRV